MFRSVQNLNSHKSSQLTRPEIAWLFQGMILAQDTSCLCGADAGILSGKALYEICECPCPLPLLLRTYPDSWFHRRCCLALPRRSYPFLRYAAALYDDCSSTSRFVLRVTVNLVTQTRELDCDVFLAVTLLQYSEKPFPLEAIPVEQGWTHKPLSEFAYTDWT